jgi:hypothetical protein
MQQALARATARPSLCEDFFAKKSVFGMINALSPFRLRGKTQNMSPDCILHKALP